MAVEPSTSLTPALKDLLLRLGGNLRPGHSEPQVTELPDLYSDPTYGDYFREDGTKDSDRASIRLDVLRTLGNCKSLEKFEFDKVEEWKLSSEEWVVLLTPLQSNDHIRDIQVRGSEPLSRYVRTLVEHSLKLRRLTLSSCFEAAAEGLEANTRHQLNYLSVSLFIDWIPIVRNTGRILQCASSVEELILASDPSLREVTDVDELAREFSEALQRCPCLKTLRLFFSWKDSVERRDIELLTRMYAHSASHSTLQNLVVGLNIDASTLSSLVSRNIQRIVVLIQLKDLMEKDWHSVGEALSQAPTLQSLHLRVLGLDYSNPTKIIQYDNCKSLPTMMRAGENLAAMWSASGQSPLLHIAFFYVPENTARRTAEFMKKCLADTYLTEITIYVRDTDTWNSLGWLADLLAVNKSIQRLTITKFTSDDSKADTWGTFLMGLKENASVRTLELEDHRYSLTDGNFKQTLDLLQINLHIQKVFVRETEWAEDGREALIQEALKRNKERAE